MTLLEKLQAAGLPVISADESGAVSMGLMTDTQQATFQDILLEHFRPIQYAELQEHRLNVQQIKTEYTSTIDTLQQIEDIQSPTNAQVIAAVKFLAKTLKLLLKLLARTYAG